MQSLVLTVLFILVSCANGMYTGTFKHASWSVDESYPIDKSLEIEVLFALNVRGVSHLEKELFRVSDPKSPSYGKYLTAQEVSKISSPTHKDIRTLTRWLEKSNISKISMNRNNDLLMARASVAQFEKLFGTTLDFYTSMYESVNQRVIRSSADISALPKEIEKIVAFTSINSPIVLNQGLKSSGDVKPAITDPSADSEAKPFPDVYEIHMFGVEVATAAAAEFSLHCWNDTEAHSLCSSPAPPSFAILKVDTPENGYPSTKFRLPWKEVVCRDPWTGQMCNPLSPADFGCTCGAVLGPLQQYTLLTVSVSVVVLNAGESEDLYSKDGVSYDLGSTPSPIALLDLMTAHLAKKIYHIPEGVVKHGSSLGMVEMSDQFTDNEDIHNFLYLEGLPKANILSSQMDGDNGNDASHPGGESMLDVEIALAMAPNVTMTYYSNSVCNPYCTQENFLTWMFYLGSKEQPELVHTLSYADLEEDYSGHLREYANRVDVEFMKFGLQGVTFVMPSGDDGACGFKTPATPTAQDCKKSAPSWPGSSPYVVSVGASALSDKYIPVCGTRWTSFFGLAIPCAGVGEVVCQSDRGHKITSGGGFSLIYERPWWQKQIVANSLEQNSDAFPSAPGFFNREGRAYPDVAVQGALWFMQHNSTFVGMSGTSASVPLFASIVVLLNDQLLGSGLPPLGFIPPLLYHLFETSPQAFNDITVGGNACRAGHLGKKKLLDCSPLYFNATSGWDAVTGLGSINFDLFLAEVLKIHQKGHTSSNIKESSLVEERAPVDSSFLKDSSSSLVWLPTIVAALALCAAVGTNRMVSKHFSAKATHQIQNNGYGSTRA